MQERFYQSEDGLRLFYRDWSGDAGRLPVLCVHGLTRNSKDFADLAGRLTPRRRTLASDVRGRGRSAYDPDWERYHPHTYVGDMWRLLDDAGVSQAIVVGTSMGGIIGMLMAAQQPARVAALIMNDVGPEVEAAGIARIAAYAGGAAAPPSWDAAIAQLQERAAAAMPDLDRNDWRRYAGQTYRTGTDGQPAIDYDINISRRFAEDSSAGAEKLWSLFAALPHPVLVLRGALTDVLGERTAARMATEHRRCVCVEVPNRGHVPLLDEPVARAAIDGFLGALP